MKKLAKIISVMALATAAAYSLSACSSGDNKADEKVVLSYASWDTTQAPGLKKVLEAFEKDNPTIKVKMETTPWDQYWTKMEAATTGGNMPDIVTMHSNESYKYMSNDMLMDLDPVVKSNDIDMANFADGIADLYTYEKALYAIPKDVTTIGIYYNKKVFDDAGVAYPKDTWDWNEFLETSKALTNESKGIYAFPANNATEGGYWPFIFQNEGAVYNDDATKSEIASKNTQEAISFYNDLINKYHVSPTIDAMAETDPLSLFESGKLAMISAGNWNALQFTENENLKDNIGCVALPKGKANATVSNGLGWSVSAKTKHPEEAKKLIAYLATEEANKIQAETGASIPAYNGLGDAWLTYYSTIDLKPFVDQLAYGVVRPFNKNSIKCETLETEELAKVFSGKETVEEGTKNIQKGVDAILAE